MCASTRRISASNRPPVAAVDQRTESLHRKTSDVAVKKTSIGKAGFTLLEIMVALSIISIALVAVYRLYAQTLSMNQTMNFNSVAPMLAQNKMAELLTLPADELGDNSGDFGEAYSHYAWRAGVESVASEGLGDLAEDLKRIDLTISFNQDENTYRLRVYRFERD